MADDWLGISSAEYDSNCGDSFSHTLSEALDGSDYWYHADAEVHWFILDLGQTYTITTVRGRSDIGYDPTDVNIYIDDNNPPTTLCEEGITTWTDIATWVEIELGTEGEGRYIKVEIEASESGAGAKMSWGRTPSYITIFDAYGDVAAAGTAYNRTITEPVQIDGASTKY